MLSYERVIGVDVSSEKLDISDSIRKLPSQIDNRVEAIAKLVNKISEPEKTLVVCESSGGWESMMVDLLHDAKVNVAVVNPRQTSHYAKAHGFLEKTDKIDAKVIRLFGEQVELNLTRPRTAREKELQALSRRRVQLLSMINQESNRKILCSDKTTRKFIDQSLKMLKKQLETIDKAITKFVKTLEEETPNVAIMMSVPGVGEITTATLCCELPELGKISRSKIAKLVGVAPIARQSGQRDGRRSIRGGRATIRRPLYMAAMSAVKHNPVLRRYYLQLKNRGKLHRVAIVACMRKLLLMLHDMVRHQRMWEEPKKASDPIVNEQVTGATCSANH